MLLPHQTTKIECPVKRKGKWKWKMPNHLVREYFSTTFTKSNWGRCRTKLFELDICKTIRKEKSWMWESEKSLSNIIIQRKFGKLSLAISFFNRKPSIIGKPANEDCTIIPYWLRSTLNLKRIKERSLIKIKNIIYFFKKKRRNKEVWSISKWAFTLSLEIYKSGQKICRNTDLKRL